MNVKKVIGAGLLAALVGCDLIKANTLLSATFPKVHHRCTSSTTSKSQKPSQPRTKVQAATTPNTLEWRSEPLKLSRGTSKSQIIVNRASTIIPEDNLTAKQLIRMTMVKAKMVETKMTTKRVIQ
jgi:hypothetical protein